MPRSCGTFLTVLMSMGFGAYVHHCLMLFTQDLNTSSHSSQANTFVRNVIKTVVKPAQALEELELLFQTSPETYHKTKRPPLIESPLDGVNSIPWRSLYDVVTEWCPDDPEIPKNYKEVKFLLLLSPPLSSSPFHFLSTPLYSVDSPTLQLYGSRRNGNGS